MTSAVRKPIPTLRYPLEMITGKTDYMSVQVIKHTPPGVGLKSQDMINASRSGAQLANNRVRDSEYSNRRGSKTNTLATIQLPMPPQIGSDNRTGWAKGDMSTLAAGLGGFAQQLMNNPSGNMNPFSSAALSGIANVLGSAARGVAGQAGGLVNLGGDVATAFAINMIPASLGGGIDVQDFLRRQRGVIINPNMEFLFKGPSLREFAFTYTFVPRNQKESEQVKQIIRLFKKSMAPKRNIGNAFGGDQFFGGFLSSPDIFKLSYRSGNIEHPFLNKFKFCALVDMGVNYTRAAEGYVSYDDGTPIVTSMTLRFSELTPIYSEDFDQTENQGGVGF